MSSHSAACVIRKVLPATLEAIEELFADFRQRSQGLLGADSFSVELMTREALTNAVLHGSAADASKRVHCSLRVKSRRVLVVVSDEGEGFDWRAARQRPGDFPNCSGRGVEILYKYASWVRYNNQGNLVALVKRFR